jgi:hypothetical protein
MSKISELSDGGSLVSTDYLIAVRSGGNVKVRMDSINVDQVDLGDNEFIRLGNSQDLTLVHNASNSIINQAGIGDLLIQKAGSTKLTVNATGIDVTGTVTVTRSDVFNDNSTISNEGGLFVISAATGGGGGTYPMLFKTAATERMRIDSVGNVGIGVSNPSDYYATELVVTGPAEGGITIASTGNHTNYLLFADSTSGVARYAGMIGYAHNTDTMSFRTNSVQRMAIDASGNLLVSDTTANPSGDNVDSGIALHNAGLVRASTNNAAAPLDLNVKGRDGDIAVFRKDGTTVGSIGSISSDLYIAESNSGLRFDGENNQILPSSTTASTDGTCNLGAGTARFKDLYLSGGAYLGGTAAANKLDDYEEGTWTPVIKDTSATGTTVAISTVACTYTKIGRIVTLVGSFTRNDTATLTGNLVITGLPFTATGGQQMGGNAWVDNASADILCQISAGNTSTMFLKSVAAPDSYVTTNDWENGRAIYFTRTYQAS